LYGFSSKILIGLNSTIFLIRVKSIAQSNETNFQFETKAIMKTVSLIFFVFLIFSACTESRKTESVSSDPQIRIAEYASVRRFSVKCDGNPYVFAQSKVFVSEKDTLYTGLNIEKTALFAYDLSKGELILKYLPAVSGPDAFRIDLFSIHGKDSIFLFDKKKFEMRLIDIEGNVKNNLSLADFFDSLKNSGYSFDIQHKTANSLVYASGILQIPLYPEIDNAEPSFYEKGFTALIDLNRKSLKIIGAYPENMKADANGYFPYASNVHILKTDKDYLVGFTNDHCLYKLNKSDNTLSKFFCMKSNFLPSNFDKLSGKEDYQERDNFSVTQPLYFSTILRHDKIYRIVRHGQPLKDDKGEISPFFGTAWSIISVNQDGSDAKEALMPAKIYRISDVHLIGKDMFLISRENDQNPENKEDFLEFEIIELK
jgi:hypothetical protein